MENVNIGGFPGGGGVGGDQVPVDENQSDGYIDRYNKGKKETATPLMDPKDSDPKGAITKVKRQAPAPHSPAINPNAPLGSKTKPPCSDQDWRPLSGSP